MDSILGLENLLKTDFAQKGLPSTFCYSDSCNCFYGRFAKEWCINIGIR